MKWLTKSDYLKFLVHPAWLWLAKHEKWRLPEPSEADRAVMAQGNEVEAEARKLFPKAVLVDGPFLDGPDESARLMAAGGPEVLFQASALTKGKLYARTDILKRAGKAWDLYEVKGSTKVKPEHLHDLAFQRLALTEAGHTIRRIFVIHIYPQFERQGRVDPAKLFAVVEVTESVEALEHETQRRAQAARAVIEARQCPSLAPERAEAWAYGWREVYRHLHPGIPADSILNLTRLTPKLIRALADGGISRLAGIPDDFPGLGSEQRTQVDVARTGAPHIHHDKIAHELGALQFPLYFLDYETFASAIPMWDGLRPYQQMPFQYSLHILEKPGAPLEQKEFLARGGEYPVPELLRHLLADLGPTGSVIVWNESFEKGCNDAMAALHPEFADFLHGVNARVYDLMTPFATGAYAHPAFMGSASIKKVLPVLVPELSYKDLAIGEGATAQVRWMRAARGQMSAAEADQLYADLITYCGQDTLAMVRIFEHLAEQATVPAA